MGTPWALVSETTTAAYERSHTVTGRGSKLVRGTTGPHSLGPLRRAVTLIDLMVTITIILVAASILLPEFSNDSRLRLMGAARMLTSDIEMAQVMTISNPQRPTIVRFDGTNAKYWLAYADTPETPIPGPGASGPYEVIFGNGRAQSAEGVSFTLNDIPDEKLVFNALGGIDDLTAQPIITLNRDTRWIKLSVAPTTGTITETSGGT